MIVNQDSKVKIPPHANPCEGIFTKQYNPRTTCVLTLTIQR